VCERASAWRCFFVALDHCKGGLVCVGARAFLCGGGFSDEGRPTGAARRCRRRGRHGSCRRSGPPGRPMSYDTARLDVKLWCVLLFVGASCRRCCCRDVVRESASRSRMVFRTGCRRAVAETTTAPAAAQYETFMSCARWWSRRRHALGTDALSSSSRGAATSTGASGRAQ